MPEQERFLYWYRARITREHWRHPIYDGDSLRIDLLYDGDTERLTLGSV